MAKSYRANLLILGCTNPLFDLAVKAWRFKLGPLFNVPAPHRGTPRFFFSMYCYGTLSGNKYYFLKNFYFFLKNLKYYFLSPTLG